MKEEIALATRGKSQVRAKDRTEKALNKIFSNEKESVKERQRVVKKKAGERKG